MAGQVRVVAAGREWVSDGGKPITFGRSQECDICLDPDDTGISRRAGVVEFEHGAWWVRNCSDARPLSIVDDLGFRSVLAPGRRAAVETPVRVLAEPPAQCADRAVRCGRSPGRAGRAGG